MTTPDDPNQNNPPLERDAKGVITIEAGRREAERRIAHCRDTQSDTLDLGGLRLSTFPEEVLELTRLKTLSLGLDADARKKPWFELSESDKKNCNAFRALPGAFAIALSLLERLHLSYLPLSDLTPLTGLKELRQLNCTFTEVSDLTPLTALPELRELYCEGTHVSDLTPLTGLTELRELQCSSTQVSDLTPLTGLKELRELQCSRTRVSDLTPLTGLTELRELDCSSTQVSDLTPLTGLTALRGLDFSGCSLSDLFESVWRLPHLNNVKLYNTQLPPVPLEELSQYSHENCLGRLRAFIADLQGEREPVSDFKLMLLGNGAVGKTQMCRWLVDGQDFVFDPNSDTTHGVNIEFTDILSASTKVGPPPTPARSLRIWDFGGQDIYHGTHALFLRSRAIFALVWTTEGEQEPVHQRNDRDFPNFPLAYWVDYVKQFGAETAPVLLVQNKVDRSSQQEPNLPLSPELQKSLAWSRILAVSAKTQRGGATLREALSDAADYLDETTGVAEIGKGRANVRRWLEGLIDEDQKKPVSERQNQLIALERFEAECKTIGQVSDPLALLRYLHQVGVVFYDPDLFPEYIILDQQWALDAIYSVFNRDKSYYQIREAGGRFSLTSLGYRVWNDAGFDPNQQQLFLKLMLSCSVCFEVEAHNEQLGREAQYIAPDLLPEQPSGLAVGLWQNLQDPVVAECRFAFLPPLLMRSIISHVGTQAGTAAEYWRTGLTVCEARTGSHGRIVAELNTGEQDFGGIIRLECQHGRRDQLLLFLAGIVERQRQRFGLSGIWSGYTPGTELSLWELERAVRKTALEETTPMDPEFVTPKILGKKLYVSYAWGSSEANASDQEKARDAAVDRLCTAATQAGYTVIRDKEHLTTGDSLSKFMEELADGDRIFVILSDKYLRSSFCMRELYDIWRTAGAGFDTKRFTDKIRVYALPDAKFKSTMDRITIQKFWKTKFDDLDEAARHLGVNALAPKDFQNYQRIQEFYMNLGKILETIADILLSDDFDPDDPYWFGDL